MVGLDGWKTAGGTASCVRECVLFVHTRLWGRQAECTRVLDSLVALVDWSGIQCEWILVVGWNAVLPCCCLLLGCSWSIMAIR